MAAPTVNLTLGGVSSSNRMLPHAAFVYLNLSTSSPGAGDWHTAHIRWTITKDDGTGVGSAIDVVDPRPFRGETASMLTCQRGFMAWYLFPAAGTYHFLCTVTNEDGLSATNLTSGAATALAVTVAADTRTYEHVDNTAAAGGNGDAATPWRTIAEAFAAVGSSSDRGIRLKGGQTHDMSAIVTPTSIKNILLESYGGSRATLRWPGANPGTSWIYWDTCANVLVRDIDFTAGPWTYPNSSSPFSLDACTSWSIFNCTANGVRMLAGSTPGGIATEQFAVVNCTVTSMAEYGIYAEQVSRLLVYGFKSIDNRFSHVVRWGTEDPAVLVNICQIGYSDLNASFFPDRTLDDGDRHTVRTQGPYTWIHNCWSRGGSMRVESGAGASASASDIRIFEACLFDNGRTQCWTAGEKYSKVRCSGCVFRADNRVLTGEARVGHNIGSSAILIKDTTVNTSGWIFEGCTIILGSKWAQGQSTEVPISITPGSGVTIATVFRNCLLAIDLFSGYILEVPANTTFVNDVWPDRTGSPFKVAGTSYTSTQFLALAAVTSNAIETAQTADIQRGRFAVNRVLHPVASAASATPTPTYLDYYNVPFDSAGGRVGAASGGKQPQAIGS